jgi:hypothetical protein
MIMYAGLDVSDKTTHGCVVDADGTILRRDVVASDPDVLANWFCKHCSGLARAVLETGPLSTFPYHGLVERAVPIECIAEPEVLSVADPLGDGLRRYRRTVDGWHRHSLTGEPLTIRSLSSALTRVAGYRMTICTVERADYRAASAARKTPFVRKPASCGLISKMWQRA